VNLLGRVERAFARSVVEAWKFDFSEAPPVSYYVRLAVLLIARSDIT
jgi:hypothetical protein